MNIVIFLFVAFIALGIWQTINKSTLRKNATVYYDSLLTNFEAAKSYIQPDGLCMIAIDNIQQRVLVADPKSNKIFDYADILSCEMLVDGQMVSSKSIGGALAGGLMFGTAGAVVGSNMGKTKYNKNVRSVKLKLLVNDVLNPAYELSFYKKPGIAKAQAAQVECQSWLDTLTVAIAK